MDRVGRVASCFDDRRHDPANFMIDRFCAVSVDGGETWSANTRHTARSFAPIHATDGLMNPVLNMGDYDSLAGDFTLTHEGFVGAYSRIGPVANPDAQGGTGCATRLRRPPTSEGGAEFFQTGLAAARGGAKMRMAETPLLEPARKIVGCLLHSAITYAATSSSRYS